MKELILIRHGKAEKRGSIFPDRDRKLVNKGINQLNKDIPFLSQYLKNNRVVYLWTSGMIRAMDTAALIKKICEIDTVEICEFIETGDFEEFGRKVDLMEDECIIIIVGHEPDLSEWTYRLCKNNVKIEKGGALLIEVDPLDQRSGTLRWKAEPGEYQDKIV